MLSIHVVRSDSQYSVGKFHFKDIFALVAHRNLRDVTQKNILKAIEKISSQRRIYNSAKVMQYPRDRGCGWSISKFVTL